MAPCEFDPVPSGKARQWLGRELDALVFDAHCGFDPDAFGAVLGAVAGGGLVLLLTPPLAQWPAFPDPGKERIAQYPHGMEAVGGRFLSRLAHLIQTTPSLPLIEQGHDPLPAPIQPSAQLGPVDGEIKLTPDQETALEALLRVATGHGRRPLVLMSDRGRGKSSVLGVAAARLQSLRPGSRVLVTAPRPDSVQSLFEQAQRLLPASVRRGLRLQEGNGEIAFIPPDELLRHPQEADLLLVDEAAAIPLPLLERLLTRYNRIAFATTEYGYEGAGRGFSLCFPGVLNRLAPHWRRLRLQTPVRWAEQDPVEGFCFRALLLDAEAADGAVLSAATPDSCELERLDRDRLVTDEPLLSELFGLLVLAHYQTRPSDLRHLLDGPGISIWVMRFRGHVAAAMLNVDEGGFDPSLAEAIARGERRPHGHLLAQTLTAHAGFVAAAGMRYSRIMRIAVHPALQRRGFGIRLVSAALSDAEKRGLDFLGASFGATPGLLAFWRKLGLMPVRIGMSREAASGSHSAIMLRPLSPRAAGLFDRMRARFLETLPFLLGDPLQELELEVAVPLLEGNPIAWSLNEQDRLDLEAFAHGRRDYAGARLALWRLAAIRSAQGSPSALLGPLVIKVLQGRAWSGVAAELGLPGRKQAEDALRQAAGALLRTKEETLETDL